MLGQGVDGASLFNNVPPRQQSCCHHAVALPHVTGFPGLRVLRRLRHDLAPSAGVAPARRPAGGRTGRAMPDRFPRSLRISVTASVPSYTPAASPRTAHRSLGPGLPTPMGSRREERRVHRLRLSPALQSGPSTRFGRPLTTHGTSTTGSVSLHPFRLRLRARTVWWCRSAPTLSRLLPASPPTRGSACLQLQPVPARTSGGPFIPQDPSAPRGAQPNSSRQSRSTRP